MKNKTTIGRLFAGDFNVPELFPGRVAKAASASDLLGRFHREKHPKPWLDGARRLIFVSDMSDALSEGAYRDGGKYLSAKHKVTAKRGAVHKGGVPFEYLASEVVEHVRSARGLRHAWLWLTKRPGRMAEFSRWLREERGISWPENLWAGTSITTKATLGRVRDLERVGAAVAFLSVEPQWEEVSIGRTLEACPSVRWVINGGESDQGEAKAHEFKLEWARSIMNDCRKAGIPMFMKQFGSGATQNGKPLGLKDKHGGEWDEWPPLGAGDLRVRELPAEAYCSSVGKEWTAAHVDAWVADASPVVLASVKVVCSSPAPVGTKDISGVEILPGGGFGLRCLSTWAGGKGLRPPLAYVPRFGRIAYAFSTRGIRDLFGARFARE
jgi:protein gp37